MVHCLAMSTKKPKPKPRAARFYILLSEAERAMLDAAALDRGVSRADVLRSALRNQPAPGIKRGE